MFIVCIVLTFLLDLVLFVSQKIEVIESGCSTGYTDSSGTCDGRLK